MGSQHASLAGAAPQQELPPLRDAQGGLAIFFFHYFFDTGSCGSCMVFSSFANLNDILRA